jgi:ABC-2 type transport system ATP-binding protein
LPDVEAVCDHVLVLGGGQLLAQGSIHDLKQAHARGFEVRVKADANRFAGLLRQRGCETQVHHDLLRVGLPEGQTERLLWQLAAEAGEQIRYLRPWRSTLEDVFLKAVDGGR